MDALPRWAKGVQVHQAGPADAVGGVQPRWVVRPRDVAEVSTLLRQASQAGLAVVPRGAATTLGWGPPPSRADIVLDTTALSGVVEHVAGDLVVVVRAGTPLADLQAALAGSGQRLALDGDHGPATLGGLVAHGLSGPSRLGYGTLRDLVIGVTFVRSDGVVARAGGKVVKNVAGYDLSKLLHGSWGTLGVLTELVFRLHPIPESRRWISVDASTAEAAGTVVQAVLRSQLGPAALELDHPAGEAVSLCVLLEGRDATLPGRAAAMAALLGVDGSPGAMGERPPPWWGRRPGVGNSAGGHSAPGPSSPGPSSPGPSAPRPSAGRHSPAGTRPTPPVLLRLTTEVASLPDLLDGLDEAARRFGLACSLRGSAGVGSLLAAFSGLTEGAPPDPAVVAELVGQLRRGARNWGGAVVVLDGPPASVAALDRWGPVEGLELMRRVKEQFDPGRVLSPGRFVGGI